MSRFLLVTMGARFLAFDADTVRGLLRDEEAGTTEPVTVHGLVYKAVDLADRLALTLVNRRQVTAGNFDDRPGGAVYLGEEGRKTVVVAYQNRKQEEILHPLLEQKVPLGLVPHLQARLLARTLRGDMDDYVPFLYR